MHSNNPTPKRLTDADVLRPGLLTVDGVAEHVGCTEAVVRNSIMLGHITPVGKWRGKPLFTSAEVDRFALARKRG